MRVEEERGMKETILFTGSALQGFGLSRPATCVVRNELNGWRHDDQVVRTHGTTVPHDLPYQPRPFPPGLHEVTEVIDMPSTSEFWPVFIATNAVQELPVWKVKNGLYVGPTARVFTDRGYGLHHARYRKAGLMVASNTTEGCINILNPDDAHNLGHEISEAFGMRIRVFIEVPEWEDWK